MPRPIHTLRISFDYHIESPETVPDITKMDISILLRESLYYRGFHDACEHVTKRLGNDGIKVLPREV